MPNIAKVKKDAVLLLLQFAHLYLRTQLLKINISEIDD